MKIINTDLKPVKPFELDNKPSYIVLHHADAKVCTIEDIYRWHVKERKWNFIGYHYFIRKDGSIYRGRPENATGAHSPGYNDISIGICCEGNYEEDIMPQAQKNSLIELILDIKKRYNIKKVLGHKDVYETSCPGKNFHLKEMKELEVSKMKDYKQILIEKTDNPERWIKLVEELESGKIDIEGIRFLKFFKKLIEKVGN